MRTSSSKCLSIVAALTLPGTAFAQNVPPVIVAMALSPLLVIVLAVVLGVVSRSWRVGAVHAGLVVVWVLLFGITAYSIENDYVIRTPLVLYGLHAVVIVILIGAGVLRRIRR